MADTRYDPRSDPDGLHLSHRIHNWNHQILPERCHSFHYLAMANMRKNP